MKAFVRISDTLNLFKTKAIPIDSQVRLDNIVGHDIVVLGGPLANNVSAEIWQRISERIPFALDLNKQSIRISQREYIAVEGTDGRLKKDYGLIVRQPHPFDEERNMFLCIGCHGYATLGTVRFLTDRHLSGELLKAIDDAVSFAALVEFELQENALSSAKVIECYILARA